MRHRLLVFLVLAPVLVSPLHAGILFGRKKEKIDPKQRVPELVSILKTDKDADKRSKAAEEMRTYDPAQFPEIVPALIDALQNDPKPAVRVDAAQSLGKLRPVSQTAGDALETAQSKDASMRVRLQARSALLQYYWAGYHSSRKPVSPAVPPLNPSREPPLAAPGNYPPAVDTSGRPSGPRLVPTPSSPYGGRSGPMVSPPNVTTKEPPLAPPLTPPAQLSPPPLAPTAPPPATAPTSPPPLAPMGSSVNSAEGPELGPRLP